MEVARCDVRRGRAVVNGQGTDLSVLRRGKRPGPGSAGPGLQPGVSSSPRTRKEEENTMAITAVYDPNEERDQRYLARAWAESVPLRKASDLRLHQLLVGLMKEQQREADGAKQLRWANRAIFVEAELGKRG